ncbi:MAG: response regulator transcription factor [Verrucomicrobia bacterium]|nr:response regulator transcription factor [Verrucomicrobiota bacterium]
MKPDSNVTILLADDHPVVLQGLRDALRSDTSLQIVAEAHDGAEAWRLIQQIKPTVAVLDIEMPGLDGLDVARQVQLQGLPVSVVMLTMYEDEALFNAAMDAGVKGYVLKENAMTVLLSCIETITEGRHFVCPVLSDFLLRRQQSARALMKRKPGLADLTDTERKILRLIAEGHTSKDIAHALGVSFRTIENHRYHMAEKLDLHGTNALMKFAFDNKAKL